MNTKSLSDTIQSCRDMEDDFAKIQHLTDYLGGLKALLNSRREALTESKPVKLEIGGIVLGGELKLTWSFDPENPPAPSPDHYFDLRPLKLSDVLQK